jgi:hypothetical protein
LLSDLLAKHCNLPTRFWRFFNSTYFDPDLEMGIPHKKRPHRGCTPTGDQEIPAKAQKEVISLGYPVTWSRLEPEIASNSAKSQQIRFNPGMRRLTCAFSI